MSSGLDKYLGPPNDWVLAFELSAMLNNIQAAKTEKQKKKLSQKFIFKLRSHERYIGGGGLNDSIESLNANRIYPTQFAYDSKVYIAAFCEMNRLLK